MEIAFASCRALLSSPFKHGARIGGTSCCATAGPADIVRLSVFFPINVSTKLARCRPEDRAMEKDSEKLRAFLAKLICTAAKLGDPRSEDAFRTGGREPFAGQGP